MKQCFDIYAPLLVLRVDPTGKILPAVNGKLNSNRMSVNRAFVSKEKYFLFDDKIAAETRNLNLSVGPEMGSGAKHFKAAILRSRSTRQQRMGCIRAE